MVLPGEISSKLAFVQIIWIQRSSCSSEQVRSCHGNYRKFSYSESSDPPLNSLQIYFSSCDDLVLKKSQIEFLHENGALRLNLANEYTKGAADLLDKMVGVYNLIWEIMEQTEMTAWYRDAMYRRIEESSILAILNSRTPFYMTGREIFIKVCSVVG